MRSVHVLLALGLLVLGATPAWAESWILWHRNLDRPNPNPIDTFATKAACQKEGRRMLAEVGRDRRATGDDVEVLDAGLTVVSRAEGHLMTLNSVQCWPPGVNPP